MKLLQTDYGLCINFEENRKQVLVLENSEVFSEFVQDIYQQVQGEEGRFLLSSDDEKISISKKAEIILNPIELEINNRKVISKLYEEMKTMSDECYFPEVSEIHAKIIEYFDELSLKLPYPIQYSMDMNVLSLYKLYDLKLEFEELTLFERILEYIKVLGMLTDVKLLVLVNIKNYFNDEKMNELYKCSTYYNVNLLLIEAVQRNKIEEERLYIIDKDKCLIQI